jgi:hypothetical protein
MAENYIGVCRLNKTIRNQPAQGNSNPKYGSHLKMAGVQKFLFGEGLIQHSSWIHFGP